jgi:hypothetical protein
MSTTDGFPPTQPRVGGNPSALVLLLAFLISIFQCHLSSQQPRSSWCLMDNIDGRQH